MKRVGWSRGNECGGYSGEVNWRWVAMARFSIASVAGVVGSGVEVGIGGLEEAMERRRLMRGSAVEVAMMMMWGV